MTRSVKKHGSKIKNLHIQALRVLLWCCLLLIVVTLALQAWNVLFPVAEDAESSAATMATSRPFRFTTANVFPFLMLPMLIMVILYLYLKYFFAMNPLGADSGIRYLAKHRHTVFDRGFCLRFAVIVSFLSLALAVGGMLRTGDSMLLFGFMNVLCTAILHFHCSKQMRHRRRQYNSTRKKKQKSYETTDHRAQ